MTTRATLITLMLLPILAAGAMGCRRGPSDAAVADSLSVVLDGGTSRIQGERLLAPGAVTRFYKAHPRRAWGPTSDAEQMVEAIRSVEADGLAPEDYHLEAIETLLERRREGTTAGQEAALDVLITDAAATLADHLRYGRVRPASLDPRWNVDPRDDAPPLDSVVAAIVTSRSPRDAVAAQRPRHFIYRGLSEELARLRQIEAKGGWPRVGDGKSIRPGDQSERLAAVRRRLMTTGELGSYEPADSTDYDARLLDAVKLFQQRNRLLDDGVIDRATVAAMNVGVRERIGQVRVNMERSRWVLSELEGDFLLVNLPAFKCYLIEGDKNVWEARTQIGQEARQTPTFRSRMRTIVFNPDWTVPPTILEEDVLGGMREGEDMIAKKRLKVLDAEGNEVDPSSVDWGSASAENFPYTLRQPPGPDAALGRIKFELPNPYSIYLHDTPSKELFDSESRTFSSGCIRVERPIELAERLLRGQPGWTAEQIQRVIDTGETRHVKLERPIPVLIVYWTVSVGASGEVRWGRDVYDKDPPLLAALDGPPRALAANESR